MSNKLILASSSIGRLEILKKIGYTPDLIISPDIDETPLKQELPKDVALRLAVAKAKKVYLDYPDYFVLAADTVVAVGRRIIDKTYDIDEARKNLELISGRRNNVYTAIALINDKGKLSYKLSINSVKVKNLHKSEIDRYLETEEWKGKSGCYSISGIASTFFINIQGTPDSIIGLPSYHCHNLLIGSGFIKS